MVASWGIDAIVLTCDAAVGGMPKPAAWAMLLAGFGIVGGAMRRRRKVQLV